MPADTTPPADWKKSRIGSVENARALLREREAADYDNSQDRAALISLFGGEPPYDQAVLRDLGRANDINISFRQGEVALEAAESDYTDLVAGGGVLFRVETAWGKGAQRSIAEIHSAIELSRTIQAQAGYAPSVLTLAHQYVWFGTGLGYRPTELDWRFRTSGLGKFLVSRGGRATEDDLDMVFERSAVTIPDLVKLIGPMHAARTNGWDLDAIRDVLSTSADQMPEANSGGSFEEWALRIQSGDARTTTGRALRVKLIHVFVPEYDGTRSHFIFERSNGHFLYQRVGRFKDGADLFAAFADSVGTDDFHAIKGLAHKLAPREGVINSVLSDLLTSLRSSMKATFQAGTEEALLDFAVNSTGDANIIPPGYTFVPRQTPNFAEHAMPILQMLMAMQGAPASAERARSVPTSNPDPGAAAAAMMGLANSPTGMSGAKRTRFMCPWGRLLTSTVKRMGNPNITRKDPGGEAIFDLKRRLREKGIPFDAVRMIRGVYPIPGLNRQEMLAQAAALRGIMGGFDEQGKRRALFFCTAAAVGWDQATLYVPESPAPRTSIDQQIAALENQTLKRGEDCPVLPAQDHLAHAQMHAILLAETLQKDAQKMIPPQEALPVFSVTYEHMLQHIKALAEDPDAAEAIKELQHVLGPAKNRITQLTQQLAAAQGRDGQGDGSAPGAPAAPGQPDPHALKLQQMMAEHQLRLQIIEAEAAATIQAKMAIAKAHEEAKQVSLSAKQQRDDALTATRVTNLAAEAQAKAQAMPPTPPPAPPAPISLPPPE